MIAVGAAASRAYTPGEIDSKAVARWIQALPAEDARNRPRQNGSALNGLRSNARNEWLAGNEESSWQEVYAFIDTRKPAAYDLLTDLKALSEQQGRVTEFGRRFGEVRDRHRLKVSLLDRFARAGLR
jgi:hypothetical protein